MSDSASKLVRVQVRFVGRVQGVGFRATCRDIASGHAVTGWVRNEADGSVVLEAQGSAEAVEVYLRAVEATMGRFIGSAARMGVTALEGEKRFEIRR
jgi:acylphosphatase